jgi:hypothetical protein
MTSVKFPVHQVEINEKRKRPKNPEDLSKAWSRYGEVVKCSSCDSEAPVIEMFDKPNILACAVYKAFYEHYPLRLSPNEIWITILRGFSNFVYANPEAFRSSFVTHQGKKTLELFVPGFGYGNPGNDWAHSVQLMGDEIEKEVGENIRGLTECNFSNASATDHVTCQFMLMNLCKSYFNYEMCAGCGIPYIELLGTPEDWRILEGKVNALTQFENSEVKDFSTWVSDLKVLAGHFVSASEGSPDLCFWGSVCNLMGLSGIVGDPLTGWISILFPLKGSKYYSRWNQAYEYAKAVGVDKALKVVGDAAAGDSWDTPGGIGIDLCDIPSGVESCPVLMKWLDIGRKEKLEFYAGLVSMHQHPDGALEVKSGWAIIHKGWDDE